ncbi:MAG: hypothetical protein NTZ92_05465 [Candidatus Omnitrophica bacterium]|nr:hypothetical protein [Candidatus Omnitrophota bacterium]
MGESDNSGNKLIYILEIVYAILLSWGFARVAERFTVDHVFYWLCMLVSVLALIRFFFAPSHNVGVVIKLIGNRKAAARMIVFFDIPLLIAHSFVFFRMCYAIGDLNYHYFFRDFSVLLLINAVWLVTITSRQKRAKINPHDKHAFWVLNNSICGALILGLFLFKAGLGSMFIVAMVNCVLDLWNCAPYYFENV